MWWSNALLYLNEIMAVGWVSRPNRSVNQPENFAGKFHKFSFSSWEPNLSTSYDKVGRRASVLGERRRRCSPCGTPNYKVYLKYSSSFQWWSFLGFYISFTTKLLRNFHDRTWRTSDYHACFVVEKSRDLFLVWKALTFVVLLSTWTHNVDGGRCTKGGLSTLWSGKAPRYHRRRSSDEW
jgi:hypothetical protein